MTENKRDKKVVTIPRWAFMLIAISVILSLLSLAIGIAALLIKGEAVLSTEGIIAIIIGFLSTLVMILAGWLVINYFTFESRINDQIAKKTAKVEGDLKEHIKSTVENFENQIAKLISRTLELTFEMQSDDKYKQKLYKDAFLYFQSYVGGCVTRFGLYGTEDVDDLERFIEANKVWVNHRLIVHSKEFDKVEIEDYIKILKRAIPFSEDVFPLIIQLEKHKKTILSKE